MLEKALDYVVDDNANLLARELIKKRSNDVLDFVRKCVFEQLQDLGVTELK